MVVVVVVMRGVGNGQVGNKTTLGDELRVRRGPQVLGMGMVWLWVWLGRAGWLLAESSVAEWC